MTKKFIVQSGLYEIVPRALVRKALRLYYSAHLVYLKIMFWLDKCIGLAAKDKHRVPLRLIYKVSESLSRREFAAVGDACALHILNCFEAAGLDFSRSMRVLDFGCGCGRVLEPLIESFKPRQLPIEFFGVDVDGEQISWARKHVFGADFSECLPLPPLAYPSNYFDAVYCISVFTHLELETQLKWLDELNRVLRPGGVMIISVYNLNALTHLSSSEIKALSSSGFLFKRASKHSGLMPDWYHTAFHSKTHFRQILEARLFSVAILEVPDGMQDFFVCRPLS